MSVVVRFSRRISVLFAALIISTLSVGAAPGSAFAAAKEDGHSVTTEQIAAPSKDGVSITTSCSAAQYIDPWAVYFICVVDVPTTFDVRCRDGYRFPPFTLEPANWRITIDCYPSFYSSMGWVPAG
jgi:hypothetical protein